MTAAPDARRGSLGSVDATRIDRWLWAVRIFKTRSSASEACRAGHVSINGAKVKPAATVRAGDEVHARVGPRDRVVEVLELIDTRVGAPIAQACYVDRSPPPPPRDEFGLYAVRDPGTGRPSKQERRQLDRTRGRRTS